MERQKGCVLTLEADVSKGGGSLDEMEIELDDAELRDAIFSEGRCITTWHRIAYFQPLSLKRIAEFTLLQTPEYHNRGQLGLFVPGELLLQHLVLHFAAQSWRVDACCRAPDNI